MAEIFDLQAHKVIARYPDIIQEILRIDGVYLAGGAVRALFVLDDIHDFDFFFVSNDVYQFTKNYLKIRGIKNIFACPEDKLNSYLAYEEDEEGSKREAKIQLIAPRFYANVDELIDSFDFTVCCFVMHKNLICGSKTALTDVKQKILKINKITYPAATIKRIHKYITYGYIPTASLYQEIVTAIQDDKTIIDGELVYID